MADTFDKDPDDVLNYYVIWYVWLGTSNTIASQTTADVSGITVDSSAINSGAVTVDGVEYPANTVVTIRLSGGAARAEYAITNHIVSSNSEEKSHTFVIQARSSDSSDI